MGDHHGTTTTTIKREKRGTTAENQPMHSARTTEARPAAKGQGESERWGTGEGGGEGRRGGDTPARWFEGNESAFRSLGASLAHPSSHHPMTVAPPFLFTSFDVEVPFCFIFFSSIFAHKPLVEGVELRQWVRGALSRIRALYALVLWVAHLTSSRTTLSLAFSYAGAANTR